MSTLAQRQAYSVIRKAYAAKGRKPVTTASTLRLIQPVVSNKTTYTFPVIEGDSSVNLPEQVLLNRADAFTAVEVGLFIGGLTDAGLANADGNYQLFGFQSEALTGATFNNSKILFFNSYLNVAVNNVQYLQNYDLYRCYNAPIIQTGNLFASGGDLTAQNSQSGQSGFASLTPTLQFSGTSKIDITINLPSSLSTTNACQINLIFRGFLSLGASNLNK